MKSREGRCRSAEFTLGPKSIKPDINEAIEFVLIAVAKETIVRRFFLPLFLRVLDSVSPSTHVLHARSGTDRVLVLGIENRKGTFFFGEASWKN